MFADKKGVQDMDSGNRKYILKQFCLGRLQKDTSVHPSSENYHQCLPLSSENRCQAMHLRPGPISCPGKCVPIKAFCKQAKAEIEETIDKVQFYYGKFKKANKNWEKKKLNGTPKNNLKKLKKKVKHLKNELEKYAKRWKKFSPLVHECPHGEFIYLFICVFFCDQEWLAQSPINF